MKRNLSSLSLILCASFVLAYAFYVFGLQANTYLFSRAQLGFALLFWGMLFLGLLGAQRLLKFPFWEPYMWWGIGGLFLLLNFLFAGNIFRIPYTFILLPVQTVKIEPVNPGQPIEIVAFDTELVKDISLENFAEHTGWRTAKNKIVLEDTGHPALVWQGRAGQFVEVHLTTCPNCGRVRISWDAHPEEVDLSSPVGGSGITVRHAFPALAWHQVLNFLALELATGGASVLLFGLGTALFQKIPARETTRTRRPLKKSAPFWGLAGLTLAAYGNVQPVLFNDDWCFLYELSFNIVEPSMQRRPLLLILLRLFDAFLPLHQMVSAVYFAQVVVLFLTAALVFVLLTRFVPNQAGFAFLVAALFLVFPADYTRLYFTMSGIRFAFLLMVWAMILLVDFRKTGKWAWFFLGLLVLLISFLTYEGTLGLAVVLPLVFLRDTNRRKLAGFVGYYGFMGLFVVWKLVIQPTIFVDPKISSLSTSPVEILRRYALAPRMLFGGFQLLPLETWLSAENLVRMGVLACVTVALGWLALSRFKPAEPPSAQTRSPYPYPFLFLTGTTLWLAGYFPIILNYPPNLWGHLSRVNLFSLPGAALLLVSLLHLTFLSLSRREPWAHRLTTGVSLVLIFVGAFLQIQTQTAYNHAWAEAKTFYQTLLAEIPQLQPGTQLVLSLQGYQNDGSVNRPLFSSSWEARCAFGLLYDQRDVNIGYAYEKITIPPLTTLNILTSTLERASLTPIHDPARLIVMKYDRTTSRLLILEEIPPFLPDTAAEPYAPYDQILPLAQPIPAREIIP
jgi:hypothetical protein